MVMFLPASKVTLFSPSIIPVSASISSSFFFLLSSKDFQNKLNTFNTKVDTLKLE